MKFSSAPLLLLCSTACSAAWDNTATTHQFVRRDVKVIEQGLYNISNSTVALANDIKKFSTDTLFSLQAANANAVQTIFTAIAEIKNTDPISVMDAVALTPIIQMLADTTNMSVETTIAQKRAFGGVSPIVKANLQQQLDASTKLTTTISAKLPKSLVSTSATLSAPIFKSINMGIAAFSTPNVNTPQNSPELFSTPKNGAGSVTGSATAIFAGLIVAAIAATQSL